MSREMDLNVYGITSPMVLRNASPAKLYEDAVMFDEAMITSSGAIATRSGAKTGRSPKDKRIVEHPESQADVWWGSVNQAMTPAAYRAKRRRAIDSLNSQRQLYVVDGFAGWDPQFRIKIRIICSRPYHALFMHNMLIRPTEMELATFGEPEYVVFNAGTCSAEPESVNPSATSISLNFEAGEMIILGTEYAGEMKKGIFTIMNYLMPKQGVFSMHCSANEGRDRDVSLFFGLSGTGKTTLSADPARMLIGDDEHCWSNRGVFNIEGGCYAKCIHLSDEKEPEIFNAIRFGAVLENTVQHAGTRVVDYSSAALTENTRAAYPIEHIANAKIPCVGGHPRNIILLTCDAFGVLPPVCKLTPEQAMYHFISGYTAKVAGTEVGVTEPEATFSACFGAAFLVWHPTKYAELLARKMKEHGTRAWLINTGWSGGPYGVGERIRLSTTRAIIDAIHGGHLDREETVEDSVFGLHVPKSCPGCRKEILVPRQTWDDSEAFDETAQRLASLFQKNFGKYADVASDEIKGAGPRVALASRG